jgi:hypothetical protein
MFLKHLNCKFIIHTEYNYVRIPPILIVVCVCCGAVWGWIVLHNVNIQTYLYIKLKSCFDIN